MKHFLLFIWALILCVAMALGSVLPGVTAYKEGAIEMVADLNRSNTVSASRYSVSGDRHGIVTVKNAISSEVIRTFKMDDGVVVRETFLLNDGKTVAASQKDHTVFWELATGKEIRRFPQRIYGFSHDETKFFTWQAMDKKHNILLYSYPDMNLMCKLLPYQGLGPETFQFSPNDRFLVVTLYTGVPLSDEDYLNPPIHISGLRLTNLFDLKMCQVIEQYSKLLYGDVAEFSPDSKFYILKGSLIVNGRRISGPCNFNLSNYQLENCTNTIQQPQPNQQRFVQ
jgi:WD40 repeat protein